MNDRELNTHLRRLNQMLHASRDLPLDLRVRIEREVRAVCWA